jgi:hypothetical protein
MVFQPIRAEYGAFFVVEFLQFFAYEMAKMK